MSGLRICLFGAAGDTGNLGLSALLDSTLAGIARHAPDAQVTVFDNGWGMRQDAFRLDGAVLPFQRVGSRHSRRYYRPESYFHMRVSNRLHGLWNAGVRRIREADAVWDVSGGDSFTDLYGAKVFRTVVAPKVLALEARTPLILLPQTYGPFSSRAHRAAAARMVRQAAAAWARDQWSFEQLRELAGDAFDPLRHKSGVDLAVGLQAREPATPLPDPLAGWLTDGGPVAGLNVSGLLYDHEDTGRAFRFVVDYRTLLRRLLDRLLEDPACRVVLVPHVNVPPGSYESDVGPCMHLQQSLDAAQRERVFVLAHDYGAGEIKSVIARSSWFCGTRLHSTIAALSSGVPAVAISYSPKTAGVFRTFGLDACVVDPTRGNVDEHVDTIAAAWSRRAEWRQRLAERLPQVKAGADRQMADLIAVTRTASGARTAPHA